MSEEKKEDALRFNEGKIDYSQLPLDLLSGAAAVMEYGSKKYVKYNYRKGYTNLESPLASILRHLVQVQQSIEQEDIDGSKGHLLDSESGQAHIHHVITSALLLVHSMRLKGYKV